IPPTGTNRTHYCASGRAVHQAIDDFRVEFPHTDAGPLRPIDEEQVVQLIDLPFVQQPRIERAVLSYLALFIPTALAVFERGEAKSEQGYRNRYSGHADLSCMAIFGLGSERDRQRLENRFEEMFECTSAKPRR